MTSTERPCWIVLLATGDPKLTHTEWIYSEFALRQFVDYYTEAGYDLLVFAPGTYKEWW